MALAMFGDLNTTPERLPSLLLLMSDLGWTDVGACASIWGGEDKEATCKAYNTDTPTRSDYAFCNAPFFPHLKYFSVTADVFPVHSILTIHLDTAIGYTRTQNKLPRQMADQIKCKFGDSCKLLTLEPKEKHDHLSIHR